MHILVFKPRIETKFQYIYIYIYGLFSCVNVYVTIIIWSIIPEVMLATVIVKIARRFIFVYIAKTWRNAGGKIILVCRGTNMTSDSHKRRYPHTERQRKYWRRPPKGKTSLCGMEWDNEMQTCRTWFSRQCNTRKPLAIFTSGRIHQSRLDRKLMSCIVAEGFNTMKALIK